MQKYESFQFTWILFLLGPIMIWIFYLYSNQVGPKPLPLAPTLITEAIFLLLILLFYGLRISVDDDTIRLRFGIGLIGKKINIEEIESTEIVRNPWYYGLGIRVIPNGMLYNAHGLDAVELSFKNKKRIIRIGSPECRVLKTEIDKRLN